VVFLIRTPARAQALEPVELELESAAA
jgi:hypothetical protein